MSHTKRIIKKIRYVFFRRMKKQGRILVNPISAACSHISPFYRFSSVFPLYFLFFMKLSSKYAWQIILHFVLSQFCLASFIIKFPILSVKQLQFLKEQFFDTSGQFNQMFFLIFSAIIQVTKIEKHWFWKEKLLWNLILFPQKTVKF